MLVTSLYLLNKGQEPDLGFSEFAKGIRDILCQPRFELCWMIESCRPPQFGIIFMLVSYQYFSHFMLIVFMIDWPFYNASKNFVKKLNFPSISVSHSNLTSLYLSFSPLWSFPGKPLSFHLTFGNFFFSFNRLYFKSDKNLSQLFSPIFSEELKNDCFWYKQTQEMRFAVESILEKNDRIWWLWFHISLHSTNRRVG